MTGRVVIAWTGLRQCDFSRCRESKGHRTDLYRAKKKYPAAINGVERRDYFWTVRLLFGRCVTAFDLLVARICLLFLSAVASLLDRCDEFVSGHIPFLVELDHCFVWHCHFCFHHTR